MNRRLHPTSPWSTSGVVAAYVVGWMCILVTVGGGTEPTIGVPLIAVLGAAGAVHRLGRTTRSALTAALMGVPCGWLYVLPLLSARLHAITVAKEGVALVDGAYLSAISESLALQTLASLLGTMGTPLVFSSFALLGRPTTLAHSPVRPSVWLPFSTALVTTAGSVAAVVALLPLVGSLQHVRDVGGVWLPAALALMAALVTFVAIALLAWAWVRQTWRHGDVPASPWITIFGGTLVMCGALAPQVGLGLAIGLHTVGAIVPLRGDAPAEGADPQFLSPLLDFLSGFLWQGPLAFATAWGWRALVLWGLRSWSRAKASRK